MTSFSQNEKKKNEVVRENWPKPRDDSLSAKLNALMPTDFKNFRDPYGVIVLWDQYGFN